ncbi:MAG TPA: FkbM family methyltransferase [Azospirillum sp.]
MATIGEALEVALQHHLAGRLAEAETIYGRVLEAEAEQPDALHLLGVLAGQTGRLEMAADLIRRAIAANGAAADYHENLGNVLRALGHGAEAAAAYRDALDRDPHRPAVRTAAWELEKDAGRRADFHSHQGQDAFVFETVLGGRRQGVFVDLGAFDGVTWSNTLFFERTLGWSGLCVEASPTIFTLLELNRACRCLNVAVTDRDGEADFLEVEEGALMMGGLCETFTARERAFVESRAVRHRTVRVPARRLTGILEELGLFHVDYLSVDIEGGERRIIDSMDFRRFTVDAVSLECQRESPDLRAAMDGHGFDFVCRFEGGDEIYARRR